MLGLKGSILTTLCPLAAIVLAAIPGWAVVISEIYYNPPVGDENLEFVEVSNDTSTPQDISGYRFVEGIDFAFGPGTILGARSSLVVCVDADAVRARYGLSTAVAVGNFTGRLDSGGERVTLANQSGVPLTSLQFRDSGKWPVGPDGTGHTLILHDLHLDPSEPESWTRSPELGGSPGSPNTSADREPIFEDTVLVDAGEEWRFARGTAPFSDPVDAWNMPNFDDMAWEVGVSPFGFRDIDKGTILDDMRGNYTSVAIRKRLVLTQAEIEAPGELLLGMLFDDGFCAFLNGTQVKGSRCPDEIVAESTAKSSREARKEDLFPIDRALLTPGENVLAIVGYNASLTSDDLVLLPRLLRRFRVPDGEILELPVRFNELFRSADGNGWVELFNHGAETLDLSGLVLTDDPDRSDPYVFPPGSELAPHNYLVLDQVDSTLNLSEPTVRLFLRNADGVVLSAAVLGREPLGDLPLGSYSEALFPDGASHRSGRSVHWVTRTMTPGKANQVERHQDIVINEIYYHPPEGHDGEFVELFNRGDVAVDISGFRFTKGIDATIADGTVVGPGAYLVISKDPDLIRERYGVEAVLGWNDSTLADGGENIRLVDRLGNLVDEVRYHDGGRWSDWADGGGSSLELIDPDQDNDVGAAWDGSDETEKAEWEQLSFDVEDHMPARGTSELHLYLIEQGVCLVDDISITRDAGENLIPNPGFEAETTPWVIEGTHVHSQRITHDSHSGEACLELVATGKGDTRVNRIETDTTTPMTPGPYTVSLWARWQRGTNALIAHGEYTRGDFWRPGWAGSSYSTNTMSALLGMTIPANLGTPGSENSARKKLRAANKSGNLGPLISDVEHTPTLPGSSEPVSVTARVSDSNGVASVRVFYREASGDVPFASELLFDDGTHDDGRSGDRIYAGILPGFPNRSKIEFYLEAEDKLGASARFPSDAPVRTGLYVVQPFTEGLDLYQVLLNPAHKQELDRRRLHSNDLLDASFTFSNDEVYYNVGVRYRGSPWGRGGKRQWRTRFQKDRRFHRGRRELNLTNRNTENEGVCFFLLSRNTGNDGPTPIGDFLWIDLRFDGRALGTYAAIEPVGGDYFQRWYGPNADGVVLKATGRMQFNDNGSMNTSSGAEGVSLTYRGDNPENYRNYLHHSYRQTRDDWTPFVELCRIMDADNHPNDRFAEEVEGILDVENLFRNIATRILVSDADALFVNLAHNAYLIYDAVAGVWSYQSYDMNSTFWERQGWNNGPLTRPNLFPRNDPDVTRLMNLTPYRRVYLRILNEYIEGYWSREMPEAWFAAMERDVQLNATFYREHVLRTKAHIARTIGRFTATEFGILTNEGNDVMTGLSTITLKGQAPVQVAQISMTRNGDDPQPIESLRWTSATVWEADFEISDPETVLEFFGFDSTGNLLGTTSIRVTRGEGVGPFLRGDCDGNGTAGGTPAEALVLLNWSFRGGPEPPCLAACDMDGDGKVGGVTADAVAILRFAFAGGAPPPAPFPECTTSATELDRQLGCANTECAP